MPLLGLPTTDRQHLWHWRILSESSGKCQWSEEDFYASIGYGYPIVFHFCPECGSNVYWEPRGKPEVFAVAAGAYLLIPRFLPPPKKYLSGIAIIGCND